MASTPLFGLLVIVLCSSQIMISSNAVPITRTESLIHGNPPQETINGLIWDDQTHEHVTARMDVELNDYPGLGANNRHTPKPQFGRCSDC